MQHRILIIDDEDDIREVAAMSLETVAGWEVMVANSGRTGPVRAADYQPDAILLDVMMPGMDGPTTFRELRKNPATAKYSGSVSYRQGAGHRPATLCRSGYSGRARQALRSDDAFHADRHRAGLELRRLYRWECPVNSPLCRGNEPVVGRSSCRRSKSECRPWKPLPAALAEGSLTSAQREQAGSAAHKLAGVLGHVWPGRGHRAGSRSGDCFTRAGRRHFLPRRASRCTRRATPSHARDKGDNMLPSAITLVLGDSTRYSSAGQLDLIFEESIRTPYLACSRIGRAGAQLVEQEILRRVG